MWDWKIDQMNRSKRGGVDPMTRSEMEDMEAEMQSKGII